MNPTRSSKRLRDAIIGFTCSIKLRRMRSATTGKKVSEFTVPSDEGNPGSGLRAWTSTVREESSPAILSSKALSRSVTTARRSGVGGTAGSGKELSFTARARIFEAEAVLLVTVRLGVVGDDAVLVFVMHVLSCRNSALCL